MNAAALERVAEGWVLNIDKPVRWTSFDVVNKIKWQFRNFGIKTKVGHTGTLDPLATGLIMVCTGKKTKQIESLTGLDKEYTGAFFAGATTPSFDLETEPDAQFPTEHLNLQLIIDMAKSFLGTQKQLPPIYSALKVDGRRLYKSARAGQSVELTPREIFIREFEITSFELPFIWFRVKCSKGTYIRSLAYDFGKAIGSGCYLHTLKRTAIGDHKLADALSLESATGYINNELSKLS